MLKKTITYNDYNDVQQTGDFYFNLSSSELTRLNMREATVLDGEVQGGLHERLNKVVESGKGRDIIDTFEWVIEMSYGVRSEDGSRFIKSPEVLEAFKQSPAYDEFFMEIVTDAKAASEFVDAIVPKDFAERIAKAEANNNPKAPQDFQQKAAKSTLSVVDEPEQVDELGTENVDPLEPTAEELEAVRKLREDKSE